MKGIFSTCRRLIHLTNKGLLRQHGPTGNRCTGSQQIPISNTTTTSTGNSPVSNGKEDTQSAHSYRSHISTPEQENNTMNENKEDFLEGQVRTIRFLHRNLIPTAASQFAERLHNVASSPDSEEVWRELLIWARKLTEDPESRRLDRRARNAALLDKLRSGDKPPLSIKTKTLKQDDNSLARAVRRRVDAGDVSGAMRLVINEGRVVNPDDESAELLKLEHPLSRERLWPPTYSTPPIVVSKNNLPNQCCR